MESTIQRKYYAPQTNLKLRVFSEDSLGNNPSGVNAIIYDGKSTASASSFSKWINSEFRDGSLQLISIPIDVLPAIDWKAIGKYLKHLHINDPVEDSIWNTYKERRLPDLPTVLLQSLLTLRLPCPLVNWTGLDLSPLTSLQWLGVALDDMDKSGKTLSIASKLGGINGFDIFDPKGESILKNVDVNISGVGLYRATPRKFDFSRIGSFKNLKYLRLIGGASEIDISFLNNIPTVEEVEIMSFPGISHAQSLLAIKKLRYLKIGGIGSSYLTEAEKSTLIEKIPFCEFD